MEPMTHTEEAFLDYVSNLLKERGIERVYSNQYKSKIYFPAPEKEKKEKEEQEKEKEKKKKKKKKKKRKRKKVAFIDFLGF